MKLLRLKYGTNTQTEKITKCYDQATAMTGTTTTHDTISTNVVATYAAGVDNCKEHVRSNISSTNIFYIIIFFFFHHHRHHHHHKHHHNDHHYQRTYPRRLFQSISYYIIHCVYPSLLFWLQVAVILETLTDVALLCHCSVLMCSTALWKKYATNN